MVWQSAAAVRLQSVGCAASCFWVFGGQTLLLCGQPSSAFAAQLMSAADVSGTAASCGLSAWSVVFRQQPGAGAPTQLCLKVTPPSTELLHKASSSSRGGPCKARPTPLHTGKSGLWPAQVWAQQHHVVGNKASVGVGAPQVDSSPSHHRPARVQGKWSAQVVPAGQEATADGCTAARQVSCV